MVDRSEKHHHYHHQSVRMDRQFRPVVNSIIFLIAANLVAKGALGLGSYQAPPIPSNVQGSLFLTLNAPNSPQHIAHQYLPLWFPTQGQVAPSSTQPPRPITQTQIVNIGEPLYEDVEELQSSKEGPYAHKLFLNRYNSIEDPLDLEPASSDEVEVKTKPEVITTEVNTEETTTIENDAELLPNNFTNTDDALLEVARQINNPTNPTTTTMRPTTTLNPTTEPEPPVVLTQENNKTANASANATAPGYGYGYGGGYDDISLTYGPPPGGNATVRPNATNPNTTISNTYGLPFAYGPPFGNNNNIYDSYGLPYIFGPYIGNRNISNTYGLPPVYGPPNNSTIPNNTGPGYPPAGDYGPYTGKENISLTYGPPEYQRPVYQKPFFSSPEDPYLNGYNQYYNNFYDNSPSYYPNTYKYTSDIFKNFYNNYPSFYNNYLGK